MTYRVVRVWESDSEATFRNLRTFEDKAEAHKHRVKLQERFPRYLFWVINLTGADLPREA